MIYCHNEQILLVDDSVKESNYIKAILQKLFIKVIIVNNGLEALDELQKNRKILIISSYECLLWMV